MRSWNTRAIFRKRGRRAICCTSERPIGSGRSSKSIFTQEPDFPRRPCTTSSGSATRSASPWEDANDPKKQATENDGLHHRRSRALHGNPGFKIRKPRAQAPKFLLVQPFG